MDSFALPMKSLSVNEVLPAYASVEGGVGVGNGGGMVVCRNHDQSIQSTELLDFYEARALRGIQIDLANMPGNWKEKAQAVIHRLGKLTDLRDQIYTQWLASFEDEMMLLKGVQFNTVPDAMSIGVPKGCEFEQGAVQIIPRFPGDKRYYLNDELWSAMDDTQKAGLVLHEIVYREALSYGHTDSIATRYLVGLVNSSAIEKSTINDFLKTLQIVHFEQTDIPFSFAHVETVFNPEWWWRKSDLQKSPSSIVLHDRIVINLGFCKQKGCSDWVNMEGDYQENNDHRLCSGVETIKIEDLEPVKFLWNKSPSDSHCDSRLTIIRDDFQKEVEFFLDRSPLLENPVMDFNYQSSPTSKNIDATTLNFRKLNGKIQVNFAVTKSVLTDKVIIQGKDANKDCFININFIDGKMSQIRNNKFDCEYSVTATRDKVQMSIVPKVSSDFKLLLNLDQNENYLDGGTVKSLWFPSRNTWSWNCDVKGSLGCIDLIGEGVNAISINGNNVSMITPYYGTITDSEGMTNAGYCNLKDGLYELYASTLVAKQVQLRERCELLDLNSKTNWYDSGSILKLDENGKVIEKIF